MPSQTASRQIPTASAMAVCGPSMVRLLAVPLGLFFALVLPVRFAGRLYLTQALKRLRIDTDAIPNDCMQELANIAVQQIKVTCRVDRKTTRFHLSPEMQTHARIIAEVLRGRIDKRFPTYPETVDAVLGRYAVPILP